MASTKISIRIGNESQQMSVPTAKLISHFIGQLDGTQINSFSKMIGHEINEEELTHICDFIDNNELVKSFNQTNISVYHED